MKVHVCNVCGGNLIPFNGCFKCESCGALSEIPFVEENQMASTIRQKLRLNNFDDAEQLAADAVNEYPKNADINWLNVLARYGIKYEKDYDGKEIPTCYALSYDSFLEDKNYLAAIKYGSEEEKKYYEKQANIIENIRKEWIEIVKNEKPYDIFISYKDKEADGRTKTIDYSLGLTLYVHFTKLGYRVFFASETLKDKIGEEYEPYIFNAINTSYAMIVLGTSPDNINAVWVKNEWSRFNKYIELKQKQTNALIVAYKGFNPSKLPRQLSSIQCLDMDSITFSSDLEKHIEKLQLNTISNKSKIDKITITYSKGTPIKNRTVAKQSSVSDIIISSGRDFNTTLDEKKKIDIASKYYKSGLVEEAYDVLAAVLKNNPKNGYALLTQFFFDHSIANIHEFSCMKEVDPSYDYDSLIQNLDSDRAYAFLDALYSVCGTMISNKHPNAIPLINKLLPYSYPNRATAINELFKVAVLNINGDAFSILLQAGNNDVNYNIEKMNNFANGLLVNKKYDEAEKLFKDVLNLDEGNVVANRGVLKCAIQCPHSSAEVDYQEGNFSSFDQYNLIENVLHFEPQKEQGVEIEKIIEVASKNCPNDLFYKLLQYYPYDVIKLNKVIEQRADLLRSQHKFKDAIYFYKLVADSKDVTSSSLWGIILCKCGAVNEDELVGAKTLINTIEEYSDYLAIASSDESDKCIRLLKKQKDFENAKALEIKKIEDQKENILKYLNVKSKLYSFNSELEQCRNKGTGLSTNIGPLGLGIIFAAVFALVFMIIWLSNTRADPEAAIVFFCLFMGAIAILVGLIAIQIKKKFSHKSKKPVKERRSQEAIIADINRTGTQLSKLCDDISIASNVEYINNNAFTFYQDDLSHYFVYIEKDRDLLKICDRFGVIHDYQISNVLSITFVNDTRHSSSSYAQSIHLECIVSLRNGGEKGERLMLSVGVPTRYVPLCNRRYSNLYNVLDRYVTLFTSK